MKRYSAKNIAKLITNYELEHSKVYRKVENTFYDYTMSCNKDEATNWCIYFMKDALKDGNGSYNAELRSWFLIAYKTFCRLTNKDDFILEV